MQSMIPRVKQMYVMELDSDKTDDEYYLLILSIDLIVNFSV